MSVFRFDTDFMAKNLSILSAHAQQIPKLHDPRCFLSLYFVGFPGVKTKKPVGLTGVDTKMVEDYFNRKTANAKLTVLKLQVILPQDYTLSSMTFAFFYFC